MNIELLGSNLTQFTTYIVYDIDYMTRKRKIKCSIKKVNKELSLVKLQINVLYMS